MTLSKIEIKKIIYLVIRAKTVVDDFFCLQRCATINVTEQIDWIEICLMAIAVLIGVLALIAALALCCLYSK